MPKGDAFVQLLYGGNIGQTNYARFELPAVRRCSTGNRGCCPTAPNATCIYRKMAELIAAYNPWALNVYTVENTLVQPWLRGYKKHAYWENPWHVPRRRQDECRRALTGKPRCV